MYRLLVIAPAHVVDAARPPIPPSADWQVRTTATFPDPVIVAQTRPDGVLVVDPGGRAAYTLIWLATLSSYTEEPIPAVLYTADRGVLAMEEAEARALHVLVRTLPVSPAMVLEAIQHCTQTRHLQPERT